MVDISHQEENLQLGNNKESVSPATAKPPSAKRVEATEHSPINLSGWLHFRVKMREEFISRQTSRRQLVLGRLL